MQDGRKSCFGRIRQGNNVSCISPWSRKPVQRSVAPDRGSARRTCLLVAALLPLSAHAEESKASHFVELSATWFQTRNMSSEQRDGNTWTMVRTPLTYLPLALEYRWTISDRWSLSGRGGPAFYTWASPVLSFGVEVRYSGRRFALFGGAGASIAGWSRVQGLPIIPYPSAGIELGPRDKWSIEFAFFPHAGDLGRLTLFEMRFKYTFSSQFRAAVYAGLVPLASIVPTAMVMNPDYFGGGQEPSVLLTGVEGRMQFDWFIVGVDLAAEMISAGGPTTFKFSPRVSVATEF